MRTLTVFNELRRTRSGVRLTPLLKLTLWRDRFGASPASTTLYLGDGSLLTAGGQTWVPAVIQWGPFGSGQSKRANLDLLVSNRVPIGGAARFSDLLRIGTNTTGYDLAYADATLYLAFEGASSADLITVARLASEEPGNITEMALTLKLVGIELFLDLQDGGALPAAAVTPQLAWTLDLDDKFAWLAVPIIPALLGVVPLVDAVTTKDNLGALIFSWSHTCTGADRLLVVMAVVRRLPSPALTSVTYNGVALTFVGMVVNTDVLRIECWRLIAPATGANTVEVTISASTSPDALGAALSVTRAHQTTPLGTVASREARAGAPDYPLPATLTLAVPSYVGNLIVDCFANEFTTGGLSGSTVGATQTQRWNLADGDVLVRSAGSTKLA